MADTPSRQGVHSGSEPPAEPGAGGYAAMFLVGGRAKRLGGIAKSELEIGGATILHRMLAACGDAAARVVVGTRPPWAEPLPAGVVSTVEDPPGSGPAMAVAVGLGRIPDGIDRVAVFPGDLPFLCPTAIGLLLGASGPAGDGVGVVFHDDAGRRQWLCGMWPTAALRAGAAKVRPGDPARRLFDRISTRSVCWDLDGPPPWFDCDTPEDLEQARGWAVELKE